MSQIQDFFSSVCTKLVGLSDQARQIPDLVSQLDEFKRKMEAFQNEVQSLRDHNTYLEQELTDTRDKLNASQRDSDQWQRVANEESAKADEAKAKQDNLQHELEALRNLVVARDTRVQELEQVNRDQETRMLTAEANRDDANEQNDQLVREREGHRVRIASLEESLRNAFDERDHHRSSAEEYKALFDEIKSKMEAIFAPKAENVTPFPDYAVASS